MAVPTIFLMSEKETEINSWKLLHKRLGGSSSNNKNTIVRGAKEKERTSQTNKKVCLQFQMRQQIDEWILLWCYLKKIRRGPQLLPLAKERFERDACCSVENKCNAANCSETNCFLCGLDNLDFGKLSSDHMFSFYYLRKRMV